MLSELDLATLRAQRCRLGDEHARLTWLRRLVKARGDLEVARLTGATAPTSDETQLLTPAVRSALALDDDHALRLPSSALLVELAHTERSLGLKAETTQMHLDRATAELMRRYRDDPTTCLGHDLLVEEPAAS
jgi:hypothetical protein